MLKSERPTNNDQARKMRSLGSGFTSLQVVLMICFALVCQTIWNNPMSGMESRGMESEWGAPTHSSSSSSSSSSFNPLEIREGQAVNLPSIRVDNKELEDSRAIYGGKGDGKHLGGFTAIDMQGISPAVWKYAVKNWTIQSFLDVGCGRGISTSWFYTHGLRTQCVEGSHDALEQSMVPDKSLLVEHDFSRGPWWPEKTFDAVWSVEFLEHVNIQFHYNYISTFRKAAILFVTSSHWGGWHHVEIHENEWWIRKYEAYGFIYDAKLTNEIRTVASQEANQGILFPPNGEKYRAQHVWTTMKVFINPVSSMVR